ncbi:MAG TPA: haloacid dehalogenase-like hydrolase [Terriglobales bacterium]|nr:haloacid dehalogenase-like hydrolase [Terriglobales bacterium]
MEQNPNLIESVLAVTPKLAVFDCDGTLWSGDAGESFFDWELRRGVVSEDVICWARARYAEYKQGKVSEDEMCGEMVTLHKGLKEAEVLSVAKQFFEENFVHRIFAEMRELVHRLQQASCDVWAVSSTNQWVIREAMPHVGIAPEKILAASVEVKDGTITDRLIRVPSGPGKPKAILEVIGQVPDVAFGNSRWDADMLTLARYPVVVNPNPDLEKIARDKTWTIYWPAGTASK